MSKKIYVDKAKIIRGRPIVINDFITFKSENFEIEKGKIILAASVSTSVLAITAAAVTIFVCKRIYEKNYFSVTD